MGERNVFNFPGVTLPTAETVIGIVLGSVDADVSLSSLPTAPIAGARNVRIRATLVVTGTATASIALRCYRGQATGSQVQNNSQTNAATSVGVAVGEYWDTAPIAPALNYAITVVSATASTGNLIVEIEEVN